jgi:hypothetical protein
MKLKVNKMRRGLLTFVLLLLCGCQSSLIPVTHHEPKFKAGDHLKIISGFYSNCETFIAARYYEYNGISYGGEMWCEGIGYVTKEFMESNLEK